MDKLINALGYLAAIAGLLVCASAGMVRIAGHFHIFQFEAITLLQVGIALMVAACMVRLYFPPPEPKG